MIRTLAAATATLAVVGCGGGHGQSSPKPHPNAVRIVATEAVEQRGDYTLFHTERRLSPPRITIEMGPAEGTSPGSILITPRAADPRRPSGPMITDSQGRLVWFLPRPGRVSSDLEAQRFKGKPVLTWGERPPVTSPEEIFKLDPHDIWFTMVDSGYREILKLRAIGDEVGTDMHEMVVTRRGSALIIGFKTVTRDLTAIGGGSRAPVVDSIVQEIDLTSGKLLLDWSALDHIPISDSMFPLPKNPENPWDAFHANAVAVTSDGNLLVSMRHTSAIYKVGRRSGKVLWTLGGKSSDFDMGPGAGFLFQHDAQPLGDGRVLLFDNGATNTDRRRRFSRVKIVQLDGNTGRASLVQDIVHDRAILAVSQGNARRLANGNIFVSWGNRQWFSEYTPQGQQLFDAALPSVAYQTYRAFKQPWSGRPSARPKVVADTTRGRTLLWVSWNGATDVASWRVRGGTSLTTMKILGSARREGFETRLDVAAQPRVVRVEALDRRGRLLGRSALLRPTG